MHEALSGSPVVPSSGLQVQVVSFTSTTQKRPSPPRRAPGQATDRRPSRRPDPAANPLLSARERADLFHGLDENSKHPILSSIVSSLSLADCDRNCNCKPNRFVSCVFGPLRDPTTLHYRSLTSVDLCTRPFYSDFRGTLPPCSS